jgi:hypothetical protein
MSLKTKGIRCSGCGARIPDSEPDVVLRKLDSGTSLPRYYHQRKRCAGKMQKYMLTHPDVWRVTHRHVDEGMN